MVHVRVHCRLLFLLLFLIFVWIGNGFMVMDDGLVGLWVVCDMCGVSSGTDCANTLVLDVT